MSRGQNKEFIILFYSAFSEKIEAIAELMDKKRVNSSYVSILMSECTDALTMYLKLLNGNNLVDIELWSEEGIKGMYHRLLDKYSETYGIKFIYKSRFDR